MIDVNYYTFEDGTNPIDPFLDSLDVKMRAKVFRTISLLEELRMSDYRKSLNKNLKDPEFKKEWDNLEIEYQVQAELIRARLDSNMTQAELAQKSGIRQSNISRIENGNAIPRLDTLEALALAMGKKVKISIL